MIQINRPVLELNLAKYYAVNSGHLQILLAVHMKWIFSGRERIKKGYEGFKANQVVYYLYL